MGDNPLIARPQDSSSWYTGIGIVEAISDVSSAIESGSWAEIGYSVLGAGLEVLSAVLDPIGTGVSWLVGWLIEFVQPLTDMLDWLAGNADAVAAHAQTWRNVGESLRSTADALQADVSRDTAGWTGAAADAYRSQLAATAELIRAQSQAAGALAEGTETAGMLVGTIREVVRDLIADCVGRLVSWAIEAATGVGVAAVAVQASARVARWAVRIMEVVQKLLRALGDLVPLLRKLVDLLGRLRKILTDITHGKPAPQPPEKPPNTPRNPNDPPNDPPDDPKTGHPDPEDPLPRRTNDPTEPHPELTDQEKSALDKHLHGLEDRYRDDFDAMKHDPDNKGKVTESTMDEARVGLDLRDVDRLPSDIQRPPKPGLGDYYSPSQDKYYDLKGVHSDWPPLSDQRDKSRPFPGAYNPENNTEFVRKIEEQIEVKERAVILDVRNANQAAIDDLKRVVRERGWEDDVIWYP